MGVAHDGGYGEVCRVPADWVVPLPQGLTLFEAMALGTAGYTAGLAVELLELNGLAPANGKVLVNGATGGVATLAIDMLARQGYDVTAVTGKESEQGFLKAARRARSAAAPVARARHEAARKIAVGGGVRFGRRRAARLAHAHDAARRPDRELRQRRRHRAQDDGAAFHTARRAADRRQFGDHADAAAAQGLAAAGDRSQAAPPRANRCIRSGSTSSPASSTNAQGRGAGAARSLSFRNARGAGEAWAHIRDFHRRSIEERDAFWREEAQLIDWHRPFEQVLDYSRPPFARWFVGGTHQPLPQRGRPPSRDARRPESARLHLHRDRPGARLHLSRAARRSEPLRGRAAGEQGVGRGDRVLIYMPMIPEAVFAMLACARIGAIHSVVFGGFAAASLATRIDDAQPKVMITADAGMRGGRAILYKPLVDEAMRLARHPPAKVVIVNRGIDKEMKTVAGARPGLRRPARPTHGREGAGRVARIERAFLHPVHVGHDRKAQRRAARHRRLRRRARELDEAHLLRRAGRDDVHDLRHRLGRGPFVHRLRAAHPRHDDASCTKGCRSGPTPASGGRSSKRTR